MMSKIRTYTDLILLNSFADRYNYLKLEGQVGCETFGYDRYLNQILYRSKEWRKIRDRVIIRDNACDLGVEGYNLHGKVIVHHMNPITLEDIERRREWLFDPEFLICVSHRTHNAIHYGDESLLPVLPIERKPGDTIPWRTGQNGR